MNQEPLTIRLGTPEDREMIYRMRHDIFALELGQHPPNEQGMLCDKLDAFNHYIVACRGEQIVGFTSITPPGTDYAIDKYFARDDLPFEIDDRTYELRLLAVTRQERRNRLPYGLLYAAVRLCEEREVTRFIATGHDLVTAYYQTLGMEKTGLRAPSGALMFNLMTASAQGLRLRANHLGDKIVQMFHAGVFQWQLPCSIPLEPQLALTC